MPNRSHQLEARTAIPEEIPWPMIVDLDSWARRPGLSRESLRAVVFERSSLPEDWTSRRRTVLEEIMTGRLTSQSANTFLFLDALDQVVESRAQVLRDRLNDLLHLAPRMILSSREAGLRMHHGTIPFSHVTLLQVAALSRDEANDLASKWLGVASATKLDGYLRSHSSLTAVADSPLMLTLTCLVATIQPDLAFPDTVAAVYREILRRLAMGAWRAPSLSSVAADDLDAFLGDLRRIAWCLYNVSAGANQFERETFISVMTHSTGATVKEASHELLRLTDLGFLESSDMRTERRSISFGTQLLRSSWQPGT